MLVHVQVCASKRLGCHAGHQEGSTLALEPWADIIRSPKQGYLWSPTKRIDALQIFFSKKIDCYHWFHGEYEH